MASTLTAATTFHIAGRTIVQGAEVDASDPIVRGREHLFFPPDPAPVASSAPAKKKAQGKKKAPARKSSGA